MSPSIADRVEAELLAFISREIAEWKPERIVVVERRGTAIFRALKESNQIQYPWSKIISSKALDAVSPEKLRGQRVLIFDDMMRRGFHIARVLELMKEIKPKRDLLSNVRLAVFAMHEDATSASGTHGPGVAKSWFYRGLTTHAYRNVRLGILGMLQSTGSLMLDTEHIEVRVRLRSGIFPDFLEALGRLTEVVEFSSLGGRRNVTVLYSDDEPSHQLDSARLPPASDIGSIVKKCRIVERERDEFAIIPICYPRIRCWNDWWNSWPVRSEDIDLLGESTGQSGRADFYGTALLAALDILRWILKALHAAADDLLQIYMPIKSSDDYCPPYYCLNHLLAMYPTLDVGALVAEIGEINDSARSVAKNLRKERVRTGRPSRDGEWELHQDAWSLLQVIRKTLIDRIIEEKLYNPEWITPYPFGLRAKEIFSLGDLLKWPRVRTSALFDILIDDGHLVTNVVEDTKDSSWHRVFHPDGEMVSELVELYTLQRGLPNGF